MVSILTMAAFPNLREIRFQSFSPVLKISREFRLSDNDRFYQQTRVLRLTTRPHGERVGSYLEHEPVFMFQHLACLSVVLKIASIGNSAMVGAGGRGAGNVRIRDSWNAAFLCLECKS